MDKLQIKDKKLPLGFTFSFPCHQTKLDEVRWFSDASSASLSGLADPGKAPELWACAVLVVAQHSLWGVDSSGGWVCRWGCV